MSLSTCPEEAAEERPDELTVASSARVWGRIAVGRGVYVAQGAVLRAPAGGLSLGHGSAVLENGVFVGSPEAPCEVGRKVVFGHLCKVIGARVGDLSEIGNGAILMPGARVGARCFLGEGTLIPSGMEVPDRSVVVGRPGRVVRRVTDDDLRALAGLRGGDLQLDDGPLRGWDHRPVMGGEMGKLYDFGGKTPRIGAGTVLADTAEVTGDVVVGERCYLGAGVKIIGDSHGPVRIGDGVQVLENAVLHLLPDNELVIEDRCIIGPGAMIHGCHLGHDCVVEPGAIVCDHARLGPGSLVKAGACVKQRSEFQAGAEVDGFPAKAVGWLEGGPPRPSWALDPQAFVRVG